MANKYLITTEPSLGNLLYFTANASGELVQIESQNFNQGFTDTELTLLNNEDYASLANGKLLIHTDAGVTPVVDITPVDYGIVQTTPITAIDLHGYSGINGISINGVGGKFAVSFDSGESWKSRVNGTWQAISPGDIEAQGMSKEAIQSLQPADWAQVFLRTQLDIMCYLKSAQIRPGFNSLDPVKSVNCTLSDNNLTALLANGTNSISKGNKPIPATGKWYFETTYQSGSLLMGLASEAAINYASTNGVYYAYTLNQKYINGAVSTFTTNLIAGDILGFAIDADSKKIEVYKNNVNLGVLYSGYTQTLYPSINNGASGATATATFNFGDTAFVNNVPSGYNALNYDFTGESLTSFVVSLPPNSGPNIINVAATPDNMHKEDVIVSCKIYDPEEDDITYETFFNGAEYQGVRGVPADGYVNIAIPSNLFVIGLNAVRIEATDARGLKTENTVFITRTNIAPIITGVLSGNIYRAVVEDPDNDNVQYRILFNGIEKVSWTNLNQSPATIIYEIDKREINFGIINTLRVEFRDEFQELGFTEEQFVGAYYGILFTNLTGDFYSTDLGEIIQKLDFGTLIAGQISVPKEVYVVNKCGFDLKNLTILTSPELPTNVYAELSVNENPFTPTNNITVGTLMQNEKKSIFVRIRTTKASYGGGDFDISAKADPA
ncbi:SPRY domain-containing protein [Anaerospora hongkongensis]|uniref:SPRY domain-containing protein n=1 Tax=Anaerospora hongkongensis TaxID=244830 RepID=UPI0028987BDF|nr:SPRY domain-containing protein [Anaerospora hongkongensis]